MQERKRAYLRNVVLDARKYRHRSFAVTEIQGWLTITARYIVDWCREKRFRTFGFILTMFTALDIIRSLTENFN